MFGFVTLYVCMFITFGQKSIFFFYFEGLFSKWHCKRNKPKCVVRHKEIRMLLGLQRERMAKRKGPGQVQMSEAGAGVGPGSLLSSCESWAAQHLWVLLFLSTKERYHCGLSACNSRAFRSLLPIAYPGMKTGRGSFQKQTTHNFQVVTLSSMATSSGSRPHKGRQESFFIMYAYYGC